MFGAVWGFGGGCQWGAEVFGAVWGLAGGGRGLGHLGGSLSLSFAPASAISLANTISLTAKDRQAKKHKKKL